MSGYISSRREFIKAVGLGAATLAVPQVNAAEPDSLLTVDPEPRFDLSPYLYMQFMEPLGTTDGSVAAAWDFGRDCWRQDVIEVTKKLSPSLIRWGGCFISYYRWKEAVGPRDQRKPTLNMCWGGIETNQVGTHEFVDFCRQTGAEPLMCVNFESDGRKHWQRDPKGSIRSAGPDEAAEWVTSRDEVTVWINHTTFACGKSETRRLTLAMLLIARLRPGRLSPSPKRCGAGTQVSN
jgi:alpha-N-arabinofuranosidase